MKKIVLVGLLALIGLTGFRTQAQIVGCNDTVFWGMPLSFDTTECCWTVLEGPTDCFYANFDGIVCNYDTLADHRFLSPWIEIPAMAATESVFLLYSTYAFCPADYSVAITTNGVTYDTLRRRLAENSQLDTLLLGAYAGQVVRLEFCHYGLNSTYDAYASGCAYAADYDWHLFFEALQWIINVYPWATCTVPTKTYVGDTTWLWAALADGSHTGLTYTWHSSLTGQTWTGDTVPVVYTIGGRDTITLVVSNAFGSDTLVRTVTVIDCPDVITAHPWKADFKADFDCWRTVGTVGWSSASRTISSVTTDGISAAHNSGGANIIASPAVALPVDSTGLRLYWKDSRVSSSAATYYVLVSTTDRFDIAAYDTIFTSTSQTSGLTQRSVSLADYAGDTIYIAFSKKLQSGRTVYITDVQMYNALAPIGVMGVPDFAIVGDMTNFTVAISQGDTLGLTVTLHSALKDSSWAMNADAWGDGSYWLDLVYDTPGEETVTVTASNAQGTLVLSAIFSIFACDTIRTFPWEEDFSDADGSYNACWTINGYSHAFGYTIRDEETNVAWQMTNTMKATIAGSYMIVPPITIPAGETNIAFMVEYARGSMDIRVSPTASTDTALFTDLLFTEPTANYIKRRWVNLGAYAGQTIRVALVTTNPNSIQHVNRVWVGLDTLPYIGLHVSVPTELHNDSTALCTVNLMHGSTDGLHYTWTSKVGGIIITNALGDSAWVNYSAGFSSTEDTITVIATNDYGADTVAKPLHIIDCSPALTLPWKETFADGDVCWYIPEGSNWHAASSYSNTYLYLQTRTDTLGSWIISKEIHIPADTNLIPRLFWDVASSSANYQHLYNVLVTTAVDYTDTTNYTILYTDSSTHVNYSSYDHRNVDLTPYAGQTIHVAFHNTPWHLASSSIGLYIDNVGIRTTHIPVISLSAPTLPNSHEPMTFTITLCEGNTAGMTYTWHSTLMDSTMVTTVPTLTMAYTVGGTDTIVVIAMNAYGADTASTMVTVNDCTPIATLPWIEDFNAVLPVAYNGANGKVPTCWRRYWNGSNADYAPHVIGNFMTNSPIYTYCQSNPALLLMAGTNNGYDSVAVVESRLFDAPLNGQMLSLYYMYQDQGSNSGTLSVGYMQNGTFVGVADVTRQAGGRTDTVRLNDFPPDVHRFALQWKKSGYWPSYGGGYWYSVVVDNIRVFAPDTLPTVHIQAPTNNLIVDDPTVFRAALTNGLTDSLNYTWHSTLTGVTYSSPVPYFNMVYTVAGTDTITVVATNAFGSSSDTAVVTVIGCSLQTVPWTEDFEGVTATSDNVAGFLPNCWNYNWNGSNVAYAPHVITTGGYQFLSNIPDNALFIVAAGTVVGYDNQAEVMLPRFADNLHHLSMAFDYRFESASIGTLVVGYYDDTVFTAVDTLVGHASSYLRDTVTFASHHVDDNPHIVFRWICRSSYFAVVIDNIEVFSGSTAGQWPMIDLDGPTVVDAFDSVTFTATLTSGDTSGLGFTWHSTLLDSIWMADSVVTLVYPMDGIDTIMVTVTNIYGSQTITKIVMVTGAPQVTITGPTTVDTYDILVFTANLMTGITVGLTYTWHSTLMDTSWALGSSDTLSFSYNVPGIDTLTCTATNACGTHTATIIVTVTYVPQLGSPVISLQGYQYATLCDTASFEVTLIEGDTTGLIYTWHSVKFDRGEAVLAPDGNRLKVAYSTIGFDTITVVASNNLGWRMATTTTRVLDCEVRETPFVATLTGGSGNIYAHFLDWQRGGIVYPRGNFSNNIGWYNSPWSSFIDGHNCIESHKYDYGDNTGAHWLISPPIHLPDSTRDTLAWNAYCGYTTYHVLLSPSEYVVEPDGNIDRSYFTDTLYSETGFSTWTRREVDLSSYAGHTVHLAFVHSGPASDASHAMGYVAAIDTVWVTTYSDTIPTPPVPDTVWRTVTVTANVSGACEPYGSGLYVDSSTVEIGYHVLDTVAEGGYWQFLGWNDGGVGNPRNILVTSDTAIVALFEWVADSVGIEVVSGQWPVASIYPNPAHGDVTISVTQPSTVTVLDMTGRVVIPPTPIASDLRLQTSGLPSGVYFVRVGSTVKKLIVK